MDVFEELAVGLFVSCFLGLVWIFCDVLWVFLKRCFCWGLLTEFSVSSHQIISDWNDIACPLKRQYDLTYPYFKVR